MTQAELARLVREYHSAKIAAEIASDHRTDIIKYMSTIGADSISAGGFIVTKKIVTITSFDLATFKVACPELVAQYQRVISSVRLNIR